MNSIFSYFPSICGNQKKEISQESSLKRPDSVTVGTPLKHNAVYYQCGNYQIAFPFPPYETQRNFMSAIRNTLEEGGVTILEAPTGTGKTLSIICSALSWLSEISRGESFLSWPPKGAQAKENSEINPDNLFETVTEKDIPSFVKEWDKKRGLEKLRTFICDRRREIRRRKRVSSSLQQKRFLQSEKVVQDHGGRFSSTETESSDESTSRRKESTAPHEYKVPKILYATRTHAQLEQVLHELDQSPYAKLLKVIALPLGSRSRTCVHKKIRSECKGNSEQLNDACRELGPRCPHRRPDRLSRLSELIRTKNRTLAEIEDLGRRTEVCGYYATRNVVSMADIILLPYTMLLDKSSREENDIHLEGSIIFIDEAHNILSACHSLLRQELSHEALSKIQLVIKKILEKSKNSLYARTKLQFQELQVSLHRLTTYLSALSADDLSITRNQKPQIFQEDDETSAMFPATFLAESNLMDMDLLRFSRFLTQSTLLRNSSVASNLHALRRFFYLLGSGNEDSIVLHNFRNCTVEVIGLSSQQIMDPLLSKSFAVIFVGGTMPPQELLEGELYSPTTKIRKSVRRFYLPHVVPSSHIGVFNLCTGPTGTSFRFTHVYKQTEQGKEMALEAGRVLRNMSIITPKGMIIFFPSFAHMNFVLETWQKSGLYEEIKKKKPIFNEKMGDSIPLLLYNYRTAVSTLSHGAILCAVINGRVSEGINFEDDYCRMVILIGLPYPNSKNKEVIARLNYHHRSLKNKTSLNYLEAWCMIAVNQAIGRAIRHAHDFSSILFLDERMRSPKLRALLPLWVKQSLIHSEKKYEVESSQKDDRFIPGFANVFSALRKFYAQFKK